jgi:hypothetical protein
MAAVRLTAAGTFRSFSLDFRRPDLLKAAVSLISWLPAGAGRKAAEKK